MKSSGEALYHQALSAYFKRDFVSLEQTLTFMRPSSPEQVLIQARILILKSEFSKAEKALLKIEAQLAARKTNFESRLLGDWYTVLGRLRYAIGAPSAELFTRSQQIFSELGLFEEQLKSALNSMLDSLSRDSADDIYLQLKRNEELCSADWLQHLKTYQARHYMRLWRIEKRYGRIIDLFHDVRHTLNLLPKRDLSLVLIAAFDAFLSNQQLEDFDGLLAERTESLAQIEDPDVLETLEFLEWRRGVAASDKEAGCPEPRWSANSVVESFIEKARYFHTLVDRVPAPILDSEVRLIQVYPTLEVEHLLAVTGGQVTLHLSCLRGMELDLVSQLELVQMRGAKDLAYDLFPDVLKTVDDLERKVNQVQVAVARLNKKFPNLICSDGHYYLNRLNYKIVRVGPSAVDRAETSRFVSELVLNRREAILTALRFGPLRKEKLTFQIFGAKKPEELRALMSKVNSVSVTSSGSGIRLSTSNGWVLKRALK